MRVDPTWLPGMAVVDLWQSGGSQDTYDMLYAIFRRDFVFSKPQYKGHEVWHFRKSEDFEDGKETLFWHLTSREVKLKSVPRRKRKFASEIEQKAQRYPDLRRSERLPWVRPMIENSCQPEVLAWDYLEGNGDTKTYIWLKDWDFVVIMKKYQGGRRRLITSFYVDKEYKKDDFERKYANRIA